jgi:hypothetical protein
MTNTETQQKQNISFEDFKNEVLKITKPQGLVENVVYWVDVKF